MRGFETKRVHFFLFRRQLHIHQTDFEFGNLVSVLTDFDYKFWRLSEFLMLSFHRYGESGNTQVQALIVLKPLSHFKVQGFHRTNIIEALSTDYFSTYVKLRMSPFTLGGYTRLYCLMLFVFVAKCPFYTLHKKNCEYNWNHTSIFLINLLIQHKYYCINIWL